jgi:membrane-bound lytic murein transglycosylase A
MIRIFLLSLLLVVTACETTKPPATDEKPPLVLKAADFNDLPGWTNSSNAFFGAGGAAFDKSCARIVKADASKQFGPIPEARTYARWQTLCKGFAGVDKNSAAAVRNFFEANFQPYAAYAGEEPEGLFTGYYEAALRGSLTRDATYNIPLYFRPDDLVMVDLGEFREELKGQRIAGRVSDTGQLKPYEDRSKIVTGQWPHNDKVIVWVDNAVDAFFVQIQGSGVVQMREGGTMRIGYAGQNGHIYTAIGKELIARGELTKENVSMQAIRDWLAANPAQADEIMNTNKSYVFFKKLEKDGPDGGEGITLTPYHSLAIDRSLIPYGVPLWVDIDTPAYGQSRIQNLMVAQDTGGAIRGPVRGDVFWGYGEFAEKMAGPLKAQGRYWLLLPK